MFENKDNTAALFLNQNKVEERHPDYKGQATVNGQKWDISAWIKTPKNGGKEYLSIAFREWREKSV